jgi:hypothetical protein
VHNKIVVVDERGKISMLKGNKEERMNKEEGRATMLEGKRQQCRMEATMRLIEKGTD